MSALASGRKAADFLIMPVQRIPRYEMLTAQLLKFTTRVHPDRPPHVDFDDLSKALDEIKKVNKYVDEVMEVKRKDSIFSNLVRTTKVQSSRFSQPACGNMD